MRLVLGGWDCHDATIKWEAVRKVICPLGRSKSNLSGTPKINFFIKSDGSDEVVRQHVLATIGWMENILNAGIVSDEDAKMFARLRFTNGRFEEMDDCGKFATSDIIKFLFVSGYKMTVKSPEDFKAWQREAYSSWLKKLEEPDKYDVNAFVE